MFAVLNLNKPLHCTSHDIVAQVRRKLGIRKVGHCGTLDPLAEGVLPICVGGATRLIEYFPTDKQYRAWVTFGRTTTSWDAEGDTVDSHSAQALTRADIENALPRFQGRIMQRVPPHAAVHVRGKKLYEYARKGIAVELPVREAQIHEVRLIDFRKQGEDNPEALLDIHCGGGTYIRSIAQALGEVTGCGAYLSGLVRTRHGQFTLEQSISLEDFLAESDPSHYYLNPLSFLPFPTLSIPSEAAEKVRHGMKLQPDELVEEIRNNRYYFLASENQPVAVAIGEERGRLKPVKVFPPQEN